jgi:predicted protein tyrosine phosphatase
MSRYEAGDLLSSPERCANVMYLLSIGDVQDALPLGYHNVDRKTRLLVADVIMLAKELQSVSGRVLIHCEAGVSRSSAAALIMYACWLGPGQEDEAMMRVLVQRPIAIPNGRMVKLADRLLDRKGRLVAALRLSGLW